MEGKGAMSYKSGARYDGLWQANKRHGEGRHEFANGEVFEGIWEMGAKHGPGIFESEGKRWRENWERGKLMQSEPLESESE